MIELITLACDYAYDQYRASDLQSTVIDASGAHWIVSNMGANVNRYPVLIDGGAEVTLQGGVITGEVPLDIERMDAYVNSAAIFVRDVDDVVIRDWTITRAWDGIRVRGSNGFVIDRVWISDIRDDAVENDDGLGGTISNSLFDGVFVGLSSADANSSNRSDEVVTIDNTLIRMEAYLDNGKITHQSPFKVTGDSPSMKIHDSVFAIEVVDHIGQARLAQAWEKVIDISGNHFLNLSDQPLPDSYPMPPDGFTVLQGAEARAFWTTASEKWIADFGGNAAVDGGSGRCPD
jgi:hypothetical protein